jgi:ferredoxin/predicted CopG family antitoxin
LSSSTTLDEEMEIKLTGDAFDILSRARKEGESLSDVVIRLSAATLEGLQRRGEKEVATSDGERLVLNVDQDKCLGAMSCVSMAPSVFSYDVTQEGLWRKRGEPLGMKDIGEGKVTSEMLRLAAESCPYRAITLKDAKTGEIMFQ